MVVCHFVRQMTKATDRSRFIQVPFSEIARERGCETDKNLCKLSIWYCAIIEIGDKDVDL